MKTRLLGGVSALVLTMAVAGSALAQQNALENTNSAIAQNGGDAVVGNANAVENGAIAAGDNAVGENGNDNALASQTSAAVRIDTQAGVEALAVDGSTAVEEGAAVIGDGVSVGEDADHQAIVGKDGLAVYADDEISDDGSALHFGDNNGSATADDNSAAANGNSISIRADEDGVDEGSSVVAGNNNSTASSDDGAGVVGRDGTAVGVTDNTVGGTDATAAFGYANTVATAHLDATVATTVLAQSEGAAAVTTGTIDGNSVTSMTGANRVAFNTGVANQTRALAVAADTSFQQ